MCDFKPGDEVVCVDAGQDSSPVGGGLLWENPLVLGATYVVRGTGIDSRAPIPVVMLAGHPNLCEITGNDLGFMAARFRKVQRRDLSAWLKTSVSSTDHLDKPLPAKKRERVE